MALINVNFTAAAVAGLALSVIYLVYYQLTTGARRRKMIREYGCLPPPKYPSKDPILGLDTFQNAMKAFKERRGLERISQRYKEVGSYTFQSHALGRTLITTIEPENLKTIQALDFKKWGFGSQRMDAFGEFLGRGIFTTDGEQWAHSRNLLRPNFSRDHVRDLDAFEVHIQHLIAAIPRDGSTFELQDLFFRLTMDSATEFLFGSSTNTLAPGLSTVSGEKFAECFNRAQETMGIRGRYGKFGFLAPMKNFKEDTKFVHNFVDTIVDKALAERPALLEKKSGDRYVFLNELVRQTTDRYTIRSELLNVLLAGRDTTASLLSNTWWVLSQRPDIYAKLRAEIEPLEGIPPTFDQLKEMKYLRALLNEANRLYPIVAFNSRNALVDTTLPLGGGPDGKAPLFIPAGQTVSWSLYAMHRRKDFFGEDAEEFNPERWLGEKGLRPGWEYLPFNGGARICLGQQFALAEASYTTVRLMQEFKALESRDPEPWREWLTLTCVGFGGCKVALTPYSNA